MSLHFVKQLPVDKWALRDAFLRVHAIGTHAYLTGSAKPVGYKLINGAVHVGVVEHDEGCVAAEFQCQSLHMWRCIRDQLLPNRRGAGETDHSNSRVFAQHVADLPRWPSTRFALHAGNPICAIKENNATIDSAD